MGPAITLGAREDSAVAGRCARSAEAVHGGAPLSTDRFPRWYAHRRRAHRFHVGRIPFDALDGWTFEPGTGNLAHRSGGFFRVEGLHVTGAPGPVPHWQQPVIVQPDAGILGILAKEFDGVLHFLLQAKMEPGNPRLVQLSPTVQATRSNYTGMHRGAAVPYLDHFTGRRPGRVLTDSLQSEHGSWFLRKANRNTVVETDEDIPVHQDFRWFTLAQIGALLRLDNLVNMDTRSVLACLPTGDPDHGALHSDMRLLSWLTDERAARHTLRAERTPLARVARWTGGEYAIDHAEGRYFRVVAVQVEAGNREVGRWSQPLFEPIGQGVTAFLVRRFGGVPHLLVRARDGEGGAASVELGPTVQATPGNYAHLPEAARPPFLRTVLDAAPGRVLYDVVHSEEGGRFLGARSRCLFVEAGAHEAPAEPPPGFFWATPNQINTLLGHSGYVNVQARTLLSALTTRAVVL
ncbi:NDP-hexose 2,3-dehydratase family protein [Streptomyces sp. NPDC051567]|uniref:NDP-hexose 2,3-dehydratase family protein n=1 Tax=Streptomyces sp. NPDC051567 TaxID=3365660 RepID=UPI0037883027